MPLLPFMQLGSIRLGSRTFNITDPATGCTWNVEDIDGWWELPNPDIGDIPRLYPRDGNFSVNGRYAARNLTLRGQVIPPAGDRYATVLARQQLNRMFDSVRNPVELQVDEEVTKRAMVRIVGRPRTRIEKMNGVLVFEAELRADDPRKYGPVQTQSVLLPSDPLEGLDFLTNGPSFDTPGANFGASPSTGFATVTNTGTIATPIKIRFTAGVGGLTGPIYAILASTGQRVEYSGSLLDGDYVELNSYDRSVVLNGQETRRNLLTRADWFDVPPFGSVTIGWNHGASANTTGSMLVTWSSAYID